MTPAPWKWWTSNSHRRLSAGGKDGAVLHAYIAKDGVACLHVSEEDMPVIEAAPDLLSACETVKAALIAGIPINSRTMNGLLVKRLDDAIAKAKGGAA